MAITSIWKITGDASPNNFDGPAAGWSVGSGTTFANTGLRFGGDGAAYASAGNKGTLIAWGTGKNAKPSWATGPGFIETSSTNLSFEAVDDALITRAICEDGLEFSCGIQFSIESAYVTGTTPPDNTGVIAIHSGSGSTEPTTGHFRMLSHNVAPGWTPSLSIEQGVFTGTGRRIFPALGGAATSPAWPLDFNKWYKFRARVRSATIDADPTGDVQYWINDQLVATFTGVDTYYTDPTRLVTFCGLLNGYTSAISGVRVRHCGPYQVRRVPVADLQSSGTIDWTPNTTAGRDLRRFWPVVWNGLGSPSLMTGAATSPALGELNSIGGVQPGRYVRIINGSAGNGFSSQFPDVWGGSPGDSPFQGGRTFINFGDLCCKSLGTISAAIYAADNVTKLIDCTIDGTANSFTANGSTLVASGLAASSRWQIIVQLSAGSAVILLQNVTSNAIAANVIRTWPISCAYTGGAIGKTEIYGTFVAPGYMGHGDVSVHSKLTVAMTDSYASAEAFMGAPMTTTYGMPAIQCNANHLGGYFLQLACGECIPDGHDPLPYEAGIGVSGVPGITIGLNAARSGFQLSQAETYFWPELRRMRGMRFLMLMGDVNDTTATTTDDLMIAQANTLAERKKRLVEMAVETDSEVLFIKGINLQNTGVMSDGTDANNVRRRITPAMVGALLESKTSSVRGVSGRVKIADVARRQNDTVAFIGPDGVHPTNSNNLVFYAHAEWDQSKTRSGYASDGTLSPAASGNLKLRNRNI
ncbi:MAG: hypothetical protein E6Q97_00855 [Desulfurellales bacterium]|nr:MAG: hypothetical protein E6Q97_00855 [Desulfurellales bacterium]